MIKDDGKYLEIDYNLLNLPTYIFNTDTHDEMLFEYAFGGEKLKKVSVIDDTTRTRLYMNGFEFLDDESEAFHHGEGRIVLSDSLPRFQFKIADHLGNTVVLFEDKDNSGTISTIIPQDPEDAEVVQRNLYYPFGMQLDGTWKTPTDPRADYLYNGKELEEELRLGWLAYGFRYYDPGIGRFTGVDPIADQFAWVSPFNYAENEPVGHIDLWGLQKSKARSFADDWSQNGFFNAVGNYFNFSSLVFGTQDQKEETVSKLNDFKVASQALESNTYDAIEKGAQIVGDGAAAIETAALLTTAASGGTTSPVTGPIAIGAEVVGNAALCVEICVDYSRDGKIDQTLEDITLKAVFGGSSAMLRKGVDGLNVQTKNPVHEKQTSDAVESMGDAVNTVAEEVIKEE